MKGIQEEIGVVEKSGIVIAFMLLWYILWYLQWYIMLKISLPPIIEKFKILVLGIAMITYFICYVIILIYLCKLPKKLYQFGINLKVDVHRISNRTLIISLTSILLIGILCGIQFFSSYPMEWKEVVEVDESEELKEVKQQLIELGLPKSILNDLSEEDILSCTGATRLVIESKEHYGSYTYKTPLDKMVKNLRITGIGVQLDGEGDEWKIIHHFKWIQPTRFFGTEVINLRRAYRRNEGWKSEVGVTGQVLYNNNGKVYTSAYYSLGEETYESGGLLQKPSVETGLFATFSYPRRGTEQRGYISYDVVKTSDESMLESDISYVHQFNIKYPLVTGKEYSKDESYVDKTFEETYDDLEFDTNDMH